ncbi:MAG: hypothetical protein QNJ09_13925, partial [Paracoccaceae bacterium]|nr:hypothetical protein [Paracoccaceae bacterium]
SHNPLEQYIFAWRPTGDYAVGFWIMAVCNTMIPLLYLFKKVRTNIAALFVILFIYGWNQYLWPLLITTDPEMNTIVMGIKQMFPSGDDFAHWPTIMATSILAMIPPVIIVVSMQRLFIRGLVDSEK